MESHYRTLGVSPQSSQAEIRLAFRELILKHHPDRVAATLHDQAGTRVAVQQDGPTVQALNEAWEVLGDEMTRAEYDSQLATDTGQSPSLRASSSPFLSLSIKLMKGATAAAASPAASYALSVDLGLFTPHTLPFTDDNEDGDDDPDFYTYECRCSGVFVVIREQLENGVEVVDCDGCSERCRVEYDVQVAA